MKKYYVISLGLHILISAFLSDLKKTETPSEPSSPPTWMDLQEDTSPVTSGKSSKKSSSKKNKINKGQLLQKLLHPPLGETFLVSSMEESQVPSDFMSDEREGLSLRGEVQTHRHMQRVWRQIRSEIYYKRDYIARRVEGVVSTKVLLDKNGQLLIHYEDALAGKSEFVTHIVGALKKALAQPFLSPPLKHKALLYLRFDFRVGRGPHEGFDPQYNLNHLFFPIYGAPPGNELHVGGLKLFTVPISTSVSPEQEVHDFYRSMENYEFACFKQKNPFGCERSIAEYKEAGFHERAKRVATQACSSGLNEFCLNQAAQATK